MPRNETKKPVLIQRRAVGIRVSGGTGKSSPFAYMLYEELYSDGTSKIARGYSVQTTAGFSALNARSKQQKQWCEDETKPHLFNTINAAATLLQDIESACLELDSKRKMGEK